MFLITNGIRSQGPNQTKQLAQLYQCFERKKKDRRLQGVRIFEQREDIINKRPRKIRSKLTIYFGKYTYSVHITNKKQIPIGKLKLKIGVKGEDMLMLSR